MLLFDLADYVQTRVPELSREFKDCDATGREYCQKPKVPIGSANFPVVPRYPAILAKLGADAPQISAKPTHFVRETAALLDSRGAAGSRQIEEGEEVAVVKIEGDLAQIAQDGKAVGYVDKAKLVKIKTHQPIVTRSA